jgi:ketosteroid isomerase-like protein
VSKENVELARTGAKAFSEGDWDRFAACRDPHVFVRLDPSWPEQHIYGQEAWVNFSRSAWEMLGPDAQVGEIVDLGDRVLTRFTWKTRGQQSGAQGDLRWTQIDTIRDGRIVFAEYYLDHAEALKAVGLEE